METDIKTSGFGGGFTDVRTVRPRCRATAVLPHDCDPCYRVVAAKKDARPVLQHRTGLSISGRKLTDDSLAHMPHWKRWGIYALGALIMTGIAPMALASALIHVTDMFGAWLESIIGAGGMLALFLGTCFGALVVCMVYLFRLVLK